MRAYRVKSGNTIEPFGDETRDLYIGDRAISRWQEEVLSACGLELSDLVDPAEAKERPCVVFFDDVFFTEMALRQFLADAMNKREDVALAMPDSAVMRAHRLLDDERPVENG